MHVKFAAAHGAVLAYVARKSVKFSSKKEKIRSLISLSLNKVSEKTCYLRTVLWCPGWWRFVHKPDYSAKMIHGLHKCDRRGFVYLGF